MPVLRLPVACCSQQVYIQYKCNIAIQAVEFVLGIPDILCCDLAVVAGAIGMRDPAGYMAGLTETVLKCCCLTYCMPAVATQAP